MITDRWRQRSGHREARRRFLLRCVTKEMRKRSTTAHGARKVRGGQYENPRIAVRFQARAMTRAACDCEAWAAQAPLAVISRLFTMVSSQERAHRHLPGVLCSRAGYNSIHSAKLIFSAQAWSDRGHEDYLVRSDLISNLLRLSASKTVNNASVLFDHKENPGPRAD